MDWQRASPVFPKRFTPSFQNQITVTGGEDKSCLPAGAASASGSSPYVYTTLSAFVQGLRSS